MNFFLNDYTVRNDMFTHLEKIRKGFFKCIKYGINLNLEKCAFMVFLELFRIFSP
jgi:hypothetical protein